MARIPLLVSREQIDTVNYVLSPLCGRIEKLGHLGAHSIGSHQPGMGFIVGNWCLGGRQ